MPETPLQTVVDEVRAQPSVLGSFAKSKLPRLPQGSLFIGAGDSYAASLAAFYASDGRCVAMDPYSLAASPEAAKGREVVFVSVSGRTHSNVAAAERAKGVATRTWGITADADSRLAKTVDRIVALPMEYVPRTPGMLSFALSLLAVLKMATGRGGCDFKRAFRRATEESETIGFGGGTTYFLGNSTGFALAVYSAAKAYEILGSRCQAELLEEFSHKEVFSLRKADMVNVFSCFDPLGIGEKLCRLLRQRGYEARDVGGREEPAPESVFRSVFAAQLGVLREASARGLSAPKFLSSKSLAISDRMIY